VVKRPAPVRERRFRLPELGGWRGPRLHEYPSRIGLCRGCLGTPGTARQGRHALRWRRVWRLRPIVTRRSPDSTLEIALWFIRCPATVIGSASCCWVTFACRRSWRSLRPRWCLGALSAWPLPLPAVPGWPAGHLLAMAGGTQQQRAPGQAARRRRCT